MAEVKKKVLKITDDLSGRTCLEYMEFDSEGKQTVHERKYKETGGELRAEFDGVEVGSESHQIIAAGSGGTKPEDIALAATVGQTQDEVMGTQLAAVATDEYGRTRILATQESMGAAGGPIKSGDPNVSDAARKREDGAAEPKLEAIDLNQPAQPIKGADRGVAPLESQSGIRVESEDDPIHEDGEGGNAAMEKESDDFEDQEPQESGESDLSNLSKAELLEYAETHAIEVKSRWTIPEIIDAIHRAQAEDGKVGTADVSEPEDKEGEDA
jgi:hypothetical protein